jgi:hypothetical protein
VGWGNNWLGAANQPPGNDFIAISAGWTLSIGLKSDGSIVCWGDDWYGMTAPPARNDYTAISAGGSHSLALVAAPNTPPVADAGADQTVYASASGVVKVKLDGSGSTDADGDELEYFWFEGDEQIATGVDPNVELTIGEHVIDLIVDDGTESSEPNAVVITVIGPIEGDVHIVPRVINRRSRMKRIMAIIRLPEGVNKHDVSDEAFVLYVDDLDDGIEAIWDRVIGKGNQATVFALFDKNEVMAELPDHGRVELTVVSKLKSGRCIYGRDTVRIVQPRRRRTSGLRR